MTTIPEHIHALRRAAWKGNLRGAAEAIDALRDDDPFAAGSEALAELVEAYDAWHEQRTTDNREDLEQALNTFDDQCEPLFGKTWWQEDAEDAAEGGTSSE